MKSLQRFLIPALGFCMAACSSFEREWRAADGARSKDHYAGRWQGHWTSAKHRNSEGALRCILIPEGSGRHYQAHFEAHWLAFSATYKVPLKGSEHGETLFFSGTHKLPALYGGIYRFEGSATRDHFSSSYDSSYDRGRFEMDRVP